MREQWKPIHGYEDCYAVSDRGRVVRTSLTKKKTTECWRPLAPNLKREGYVSYALCKDKIRYDRFAHRLVWEAFRSPLKPGQQINHLNGDKADNRLSNLEACNQSRNMTHAYRVLKIPPANNPSFGSKNGSAKLTEPQVSEILALYATGKYHQKVLGKKYGVSQKMISLITRREMWRHVAAATSVID